MVVIGIIALLISMLLPALNKARAAARVTQCLSNQRQLATAIMIFSGSHKGWAPGSSEYWWGGTQFQGVGGVYARSTAAPWGPPAGPSTSLLVEGKFATPAVFICPEATDPTLLGVGFALGLDGVGIDVGWGMTYAFNPYFVGSARPSSSQSSDRLIGWDQGYWYGGLPFKLVKARRSSDCVLLADAIQGTRDYLAVGAVIPNTNVTPTSPFYDANTLWGSVGVTGIHGSRSKPVAVVTYVDGHSAAVPVFQPGAIGNGRVPCDFAGLR